jgi:glycolate oxidase FAD binding subunit
MTPVVSMRPGTEADAIDRVVPRSVAEPDSPEAFAETLARAANDRQLTVIRGGGTKIDWGRPPRRVDLVVSTARLNRLVAHRHGDLTATAQSGMTLGALNQALSAQNQWLPLDTAFEGATIGGLVATNDAGPSRHRHGTPRDLVIGITLALTDGRLIKAGGTVVKNVAGYDLGKLMSGSHGTLAGIVDVTFKLMPVPRTSSTLGVIHADAGGLARDVEALMASQIEPAALDVWAGRSEASPYRLKLRIATSPAATDAQIAAARALVSGASVVATGDEERALWARHLESAWRGDATLRFSWLPDRLPRVLALVADLQRAGGVSATLVARAMGTGLLRLMGEVAPLTRALDRLRAGSDVANVVVLRAPRAMKEAIDVWGPPRDSDTAMRSLKQMFDPAGILNANRGPV